MQTISVMSRLVSSRISLTAACANEIDEHCQHNSVCKRTCTGIVNDVALVSDSFVNSQEWTLSRGVPDLRLVSFVC